MQRFDQNKTHTGRNMWISILAFCLIIGLFYAGVSVLSRTSLQEQEKNLLKTLQKGVIQCYTIEGSYPESLDYLKEHYGITYDMDKFYVGYQVSGSNIMPDITVIPKDSKRRGSDE